MRTISQQLRIDSAGTHGYHIGEPPDPRSQKVALSQKVDLSGLRARQVTRADFTDFDLILAMDYGHYEHLLRMKPKNATAKLALFLDYAGMGKRDVPDPYYGSIQDFEACFALIEEGCRAIVNK